MYQIRTYNKISPIGLAKLNPSRYEIDAEGAEPDAILVRSADLKDLELNPSLLAIARAGAGYNNIPVERCAEQGIVVFNTPGANANAVKELALCALFLASRDIKGGINWLREQSEAGVEVSSVVEKGKAQFVGPDLMHKTLGVVGLGMIGAAVANAAVELGMEVWGFDPYLSVASAVRLDNRVHLASDINELYRRCDYLTLHTVLSDSTRGMIGMEAVAAMKPGLRLINLARGEIVNDSAVLAGLESGKVAVYVTDFPNNRLLANPHVVGLPHLGASTPESELNCAVMAAREIREYLETGNIVNSVNYPSLSMDPSGVQRLCVLHRNIPAMLAKITTLLSNDGINVENMGNKSRGEYAYTVIDLGSEADDSVIREVEELPGVIRVRSLLPRS